MTPKRRTADNRNTWGEFFKFRAHFGYVFFLVVSVASSSYAKDWVNWQINLNERVKTIEVDRARLIENAQKDRAQMRKDFEDQTEILRADIRELRAEIHRK